MKKYRVLQSENGAAFVMTIIAFMVILILTTSVFVLASGNTNQVSVQNDGMDSYYIARSGAEAAYQAVREAGFDYAQFETGTTVLNDTIAFSEGTAEVEIQGFDDGSTRRIRISSVGTADGTSVSRRSILEFDYDGYGNIKWSR